MEWQAILIELVETVSGLAPELWVIVRRQAVVNGIANAILCVVSVGLIFLSRWMIRKGREMKDEDELSYWEPFLSGGVVLVIVSSVMTIAFGLATLVTFVNLDYYAIKILVDMVKG